jgi:lysyl-tRNA synthetase class 2
MSPSPERSFRPTARWKNLQLRIELLERTRFFFRQRGYLEVETPLLSHDAVVDRHLDPVPVTLFRDARQPGEGQRLFLQTSPEFAMKRLLAAGSPSIFQICKAVRGGDERGPLHNPEFTMLEWYGVGDDYAAGMQVLSDLANVLLDRGPAERLTYREAFRRYANVDPFASELTDLIEAMESLGNGAPSLFAALEEADQRDLALDLLLTGAVEPQLGRHRPTILHDYPPSQAALAVVRDDDPPVAERFELYVDGIELANGYHELLDPDELRRRNIANNALRRVDRKFELPVESRLIEAMQAGLPPCAGCALGFDRLVMVAAGATSIEEVIAFPIDIA